METIRSNEKIAQQSLHDSVSRVLQISIQLSGNFQLEIEILLPLLIKCTICWMSRFKHVPIKCRHTSLYCLLEMLDVVVDLDELILGYILFAAAVSNAHGIRQRRRRH